MADSAEPLLDLSILIVNFNTRDLAIDCIRSIYAETRTIRFEIIVFDNASTDGSAAALRESFPGVRVIESSANLGFPEANNRAIPLARGRYVLLLNPDTVILDRALEIMVAFMDQHPDVSVTGPKMYDAQLRPWRYETWYFSPLRYLLGPLLLRWRGDIGDQEVEWVCGACLMIRRSVIDRIGLLDNFMFGEDTDWCYRARRAGGRIYHLGRAHIIHYWGAAAAVPEKAAGRVFVTRQSKLYYVQKHYGRREFILFSLVLALEALVKLPLLTLQARFGASAVRQRRRGQAVGYWRLLRALLSSQVLSKGKEWWEYTA